MNVVSLIFSYCGIKNMYYVLYIGFGFAWSDRISLFIITEDDTPSGFPMEVLECCNLEYLYMYYQGIVSVPPEIEKLQDLKILSIAHNPNLLSVAAEVGTISSLNR